ncbi:hypothetical protein CcCBS67573_g10705 [Chytriomyces confervae]|uniref:Zinc/iron permease n=1 Tax=Chytriomyces confervae TaxID=246404 RepID=A0A507CG84_9FUNG|nr:hypothetical protein CcCBS67573_g10705 [Chytriomyces confervae]
MSAPSSLPLLLALVAGGGTSIGAVILLVAIPSPPPVNALSAANASLFGRLQAVSAGVMLALSIGLFVEAETETGITSAVACAVVGFIIMLAIEKLLVHQTETHSHVQKDIEMPLMDDQVPSLPANQNASSFERFLMGLVAADTKSANTLSLVRSSFVTYMGLAIHNLPEGISVALTTASNLKLGVSLCVAILLHNVLEGMVVALPLWYTSRSRARVLILTFINGLMEPLGVVIAWCLGGGNELFTKPGRINKMLCGVSGIMVAIAFGELLPSAVEWIEKGGVVSFTSGGSGGGGVEEGSEGSGAVAANSRSKREVVIRVSAWTLVGVFGGWAVMSLSDFILNGFDL